MDRDESARLVLEAARNNAALCDAVCRSHGLPVALAADAWSSPQRTPEYYPDAVTLERSVTADSVLARIDARPGASIKDSFATLDLSGAGFRVLFSASWIAREPGPATPKVIASDVRWDLVADAGSLVEWETGWSGAGASSGRFRPELLAEPDFFVLRGVRDGATVAGAVINSSDSVVGVSNVFASGAELDAAWAGCLDEISRRFPQRTVVGYESGAMLDAGRRAGFRSIGPLRVWVND